MLYKNDEQYKLFPKEVEALVKHFHNKFPVKVVYPPERIQKSRLKHNRLPDKPNSISFDLKSVVRTDTGTEVWRYAEEVIIDNNGNKKYTPKKFKFNGARYLDRSDIDLIYFLLNKSEYCRDGKNQGKMVKFVFEDLVTEAEKKAEKKALEAKIDTLLFNREDGLSEAKLREVAGAYFIKNVDTLTVHQVSIVVGEKIHSTKGGIDKFFDMIGNDEELKTRNSIQKAINKNLIFYDLGKKSWFWKTAEGKTELITKVPPSSNANDALYGTFLGNQSFRDDIEAALLTNNPKAGKKADKEVPDATDDEK
jgi:hypothetical protein